MAAHPVDRLYRSVRALRIYEGTTEIQHLIIGGRMVADAKRERTEAKMQRTDLKRGRAEAKRERTETKKQGTDAKRERAEPEGEASTEERERSKEPEA